jgi:integrase
MIIAAVDSGMRRGEMLALRFGDIDWKRRMITLKGATTKSRRTRLVPIGTARLLAVLEWLRLDSAQDFRPEDRCLEQLVRRSGLDRFREGGTFKNLSRSHRTELRSLRRPSQGIRYKSLTACGMESWYRYGL